MKYFVIFSIFCLVGANSLLMNQGAGIKLEDDEKKAMEQCARELNVDASKYTHAIDIDEYAENPDEETTCMVACGIRTLISEKLAQGLTGSNNRQTLHNGFMKLIDEARKNHFDEAADEYSIEVVVNKVEQCYANEPTECGFFKCVEFYKPPYASVIIFNLMHGLLHGASESQTDSTIEVISEYTNVP